MDHTTLRVGHGFDRHRLSELSPVGEGKPLLVGGVGMDSDLGPVAYSDGDCLLHAITDALLGGAGLEDIGQLFPNTDERWRDADSAELLSQACGHVRDAGWGVVNVDCTLVLDAPKIGERKETIVRSIASILGIPEECVNVKGKTHERDPDDTSQRIIEAHVVALLARGSG